MTFVEFITKYRDAELTVVPLAFNNGKLTLAVDGHIAVKNGDIDYFYFIMTGNFNIYLLKDAEGWKLDNAITILNIDKIDSNKNIYSIQEYFGAYIEFSVENCTIEEFSYKDFQKRLNKR